MQSDSRGRRPSFPLHSPGCGRLRRGAPGARKGIDNAEIIETVHARRAPMIHVSTLLLR
jgi:hypothetical protein